MDTNVGCMLIIRNKQRYDEDCVHVPKIHRLTKYAKLYEFYVKHTFGSRGTPKFPYTKHIVELK